MATCPNEKPRLTRIWRDFSLAWFLLALAVAFMVMHFLAGIAPYAEEQAAHGEAFIWGSYIQVWFRDTVENLQSEVWQILIAVIATKYLIFRGSPESRSESDRLEARVQEIQSAVLEIRRSIRPH